MISDYEFIREEGHLLEVLLIRPLVTTSFDCPVEILGRLVNVRYQIKGS
ncbi:hypothetical protein [Lactobacillus sp. Sy-1]|nr:hypothetical protein [Lactobacillus sp. Sy-1]